MVLIFAVELICGLLLRLIIGECPWNYANNTFSICGIITLNYAPVWIAYGIMFEKIHDVIVKIENSFKENVD